MANAADHSARAVQAIRPPRPPAAWCPTATLWTTGFPPCQIPSATQIWSDPKSTRGSNPEAEAARSQSPGRPSGPARTAHQTVVTLTQLNYCTET